MHKKSTLAMCLLLAAMCAPLLTADEPTEPGGHVLRIAPAAKPLKLVYRTERKVSTWQPGMGASKLAGCQTSFTMLVRAAEQDRSVSARLKRIQGGGQFIDGQVHFDTDKPKTCEQVNGQPLYLCALRLAPFGGKPDKSGRVTTMSVDAKIIKKMAASLEGIEQRDQLVRDACDMTEQMLTDIWAYLPGQPVAIGDSWQVTRNLLPMNTDLLPEVHQADITCTLLGVAKRKDGRVAKVILQGKSKAAGDADAPIKEYDLTGAMCVNLDTGQAMKLRLKLWGSLKDSQTGRALLSVQITNNLQLGPDETCATQTATRPAATPD
jgi:hypothetical protein